jgi:tetratricopeptide (TPR) repeat protein
VPTTPAPLLFYLTVFKKPEKQESLPHQEQPEPAHMHAPAIIWNVPYPRNPFFTGREQLVEALHTHLRQASTAALTQPPAITGLGGIGKTQVAIEYAHRYRHEYRCILWVNAASLQTLIEGLVSIARLVEVAVKDEPDQRVIVEAARQWLATHEGWLLILDNADDLQLASDFLPTTGKGHLLLTTRTAATGSVAQSFPVEKLDEAEGVLFLLRRAKILTTADASASQASPGEQRLARSIVQELDGFPLALDQAGAYIEETPSTLEAYLTGYRRRHLELLGERGTDSYHHTPVAATWSLNFQEVERVDAPATELLRFLAFLAPDAIPEDLLVGGASELGPQLEGMATDATLLDRPVKTLTRFSLVQRHLDRHVLIIHRLVQAVLQARMTDQERQQWAERTVRAVNRAFPDVKEVATWPQCEQYLPHALACTKLIDTYALNLSESAYLLNRTAFYLDDQAQYPQAEPLYQRALAIREQVLGPQHPDTALSLNNLAFLYYNQGKYAEAEPLYQRALTIREQVLGPQHPDTANSLNNLAVLYANQGKYEQAEPFSQRALTISEQVLGPQHRATARSLNNLAELYRKQGKYAEAEPLYQRALIISEQVLGPQHPDTARYLNNLAFLYEDQGKYAEAEPLYQRALAIKEQVLGLQHPSTATSLNNLAGFYEGQGKYAEAEPLLKRALAIREQVLGLQHPDTAASLNNLAEHYRKQEKYAEAEPLYQRALTVCEKTLGTGHSSTKTMRENYRLFVAEAKKIGNSA